MNPKMVLQVWRQNGLPVAVAEHRFHPARKWRFDFAFVRERVAVEVQGGIFMRRGGHNTGPALRREHVKRNAAAVLGWRILYCEPLQVMGLDFMEELLQALEFNPIKCFSQND